MKDLHTHILPNVDEGPATLEESLMILKDAYLNGVTDIVLTPSYSSYNKYVVNNKDKNALLKELKQWLECSNISINLYLGNVVDLSDSMVSLEEEILTINNSRYLLVRLDTKEMAENIIGQIEKIRKKNIVPVIVCPDEWGIYYKNYDFLFKLRTLGCLFQGSIKGLYIKYGYKNKKMLKFMLQRGMIDFMASDVCNRKDRVYQRNYIKKLLRIVRSKERVNELLNDNFEKVINDLDFISQEK